MGFNVPNSNSVGAQNVFQRPNLELSKKDTSVVTDTSDESIMPTTTTDPVRTPDESIMLPEDFKPGIVAEEKVDIMLGDRSVASGKYCKELDVPPDKIIPDDPLEVKPSDAPENRYVQITLPTGEVVYAKEEASFVPGEDPTYTYKDADGNIVTAEKFDSMDELTEPRILYEA